MEGEASKVKNEVKKSRDNRKGKAAAIVFEKARSGRTKAERGREQRPRKTTKDADELDINCILRNESDSKLHPTAEYEHYMKLQRFAIE